MYDELLTGEALADMRKPIDDTFSAMPPQPSYAQIPHFLIPGPIDSDVIREIIFHYYKTRKYPPLARLEHCDTFLQRDFYGAGITGADVALPHLAIETPRRPSSPGEGGFQSLLEHKHIWSAPDQFVFQVNMDVLNEWGNVAPEIICQIHEALTAVFKAVDERGAKTRLGLVEKGWDGVVVQTDMKEHIQGLFEAQGEEVRTMWGKIRSDLYWRLADAVKEIVKKVFW